MVMIRSLSEDTAYSEPSRPHIVMPRARARTTSGNSTRSHHPAPLGAEFIPARNRAQSEPVFERWEVEDVTVTDRPKTVGQFHFRTGGRSIFAMGLDRPRTACASTAWTANMYRKRRPAKVETTNFTRYHACESFPSRPQSVADPSTDDAGFDAMRDIPCHKKRQLSPSRDRTVSAERRQRAASADSANSSTPTFKMGSRGSKGSPAPRATKPKDKLQEKDAATPFGRMMQERGLVRDVHGRNVAIKAKQLDGKPFGDFLWMAWKLEGN